MTRGSLSNDRLGLWSASCCALLSLAYVLAQLLEWWGLFGSAGGPHSSSTAYALVLLLTPSLLLGPAFVLLVASIAARAPAEHRAHAYAALACAAVYAALTGTIYFVQLSIVVPKLASGSGLGPYELLRFVPFTSPLYAVDILGYAFMSVAAGLAAVALPLSRSTRGARWALLAVAAVLPFLVGQMFWPWLIWPASTWGISFPAAAMLLMRHFRAG